jgi:hypothetical protein
VLMILGIVYLAFLLISYAVGAVILVSGVVLLFLGWRGRRIAASILAVGLLGAAVAAFAFWVLLTMLDAPITREALSMWGAAGFGWGGLVGGLAAGGIEAFVVVWRRLRTAS